MPLTKTGDKVLGAMKAEYGPKKGTSVFYASMNKGTPGSKTWHRTRRPQSMRSASKGR